MPAAYCKKLAPVTRHALVGDRGGIRLRTACQLGRQSSCRLAGRFSRWLCGYNGFTPCTAPARVPIGAPVMAPCRPGSSHAQPWPSMKVHSRTGPQRRRGAQRRPPERLFAIPGNRTDPGSLRHADGAATESPPAWACAFLPDSSTDATTARPTPTNHTPAPAPYLERFTSSLSYPRHARTRDRRAHESRLTGPGGAEGDDSLLEPHFTNRPCRSS